MYRIVRAYDDLGKASRDTDIRERPRKRLLVIVRVCKYAGSQNFAVRTQNLPPVGVVLPSLVIMPHRDIEPADRTALAGDIHVQHIGFAGKGRQAQCRHK